MQDFPAETEKPRKIMFIDIGASQTQMSIVDYNKGKLIMRGTAYDQQLGGRDLDGKLREHFADEFDAKYKVCSSISFSPKTIPRSKLAHRLAPGSVFSTSARS